MPQQGTAGGLVVAIIAEVLGKNFSMLATVGVGAWPEAAAVLVVVAAASLL